MFIYDALPGILTVVILVVVFGAIVLGVILAKKHIKFFQSDEQPKSDKEIAQEELDRLLEPVDTLTPASEEAPEEKPSEDEKPE